LATLKLSKYFFCHTWILAVAVLFNSLEIVASAFLWLLRVVEKGDKQQVFTIRLEFADNKYIYNNSIIYIPHRVVISGYYLYK